MLSILFFIFSFLITHEVTVADSLQLSGILMLDVATGAMIWVLVSRKSVYSVFEIFGVGVALGTSLNTIGQLIFRTTPLGIVFNFVSLLVVSAIYYTANNRRQYYLNVTKPESKLVLGVCAVSTLLLCADRYYLWVATAILFAGFYFAKQIKIYSFLVIGIALGVSSWVESLIFGQRTTTSYISGWDGVIFEASSKALVNYGPFDNIYLANIKYSYYWFQDAWAGAITQRAHSSNWVVVTNFGPIVIAISFVTLLFVVLSRHSMKSIYIFLILALVATQSLVGAPSNLFNLASFSQVVAMLWLSLALFLVDEFFADEHTSKLITLVFVLSLLVMTKITTAVPLIIGLVIAGVFLVFKYPRRRASLLFLGSTIATIAVSAIAYLIFIKPEPAYAQTYFNFSFGTVDYAFGIVSGIFLVDFVSLATIRFIPVLKALRSPELKNRSVFLVWYSIAVVSLFMALSITFELSVANTYMILPFLIALTILVGVELFRKIGEEAKFFNNYQTVLTIGAIIGALTGAGATLRLHNLNFQYVTSSLPIAIAELSPICVVALVGLTAIALEKFTNFKIPKLTLLTVVCLTTTTGSYFAHSFREVQRANIFESNGWQVENFENVESVISELNPFAKFLNLNLDRKDVIASNSTSEKGLLAALTGIRNYASSSTADMQGVQDRYKKQAEFARTPDDSTYDALRKDCVTWYYYDKDENNTNLDEFKPFATVEFEDAVGAVLKLKDQTPSPAECKN